MAPDYIGDARKQHPLRMELRSVMQEKENGGAKGFRGRGFARARKRALYRARHRSVNTGLTRTDAKLQVDHISPYRQGGLSSQTNAQVNLRVTDFTNNRFTDAAEGFQERPPRRRLERF